MKRSLVLALLLPVALAGVWVVAVGGIHADPVTSAPIQAMVRVIHAVPDAPAVDVLVNGTPILPGATFGTLTEYLPVEPGTYTVTLVTTLGSLPILTRTVTVTAASDYTLAAYGTATALDAVPLDLLMLLDDNSVPSVGKAKARLIHLSPGSPPVDVAIHGGPTLFNDVAFGQATPYVEMPAGSYNLDLMGEVLGIPVTIPVSVTAEFNSVYSFFAVGVLPTVDIVKGTDAQYARVRGFHGVSDAPPVDLWLDEAMAFSDVAYKDLTDYAAVLSGTYTLGLAPAGVPVPILTRTLILTDGMDFTIAAAGTLTVTDLASPELVSYVDDNTPPLPGQAHVRFIHLVPDAPLPVTVVLTDTFPLFSNVTYKEAAGYAAVPAGTYDVQAYLTGIPVPVAIVSDTTFSNGVIYTAFGVGLANGPAPVEIVLTPVYRVWLPLVARGN